jgi:hypothetical protein
MPSEVRSVYTQLLFFDGETTQPAEVPIQEVPVGGR